MEYVKIPFLLILFLSLKNCSTNRQLIYANRNETKIKNIKNDEDKSSELCILAKAKTGWCQRYRLQLIKPIATMNLLLKHLPTKVSEVANRIIKSVPTVGMRAQKLGNGVNESNEKIENAIKNMPSNPAISLNKGEINLKE